MSDTRQDDQGASAKGVGQGQDGIHGVASIAKDNISEIADTTGGEASSLLHQVRTQAGTALSEQKDGLADRIDELAEAAHKSGAQFEGKQDWLAGAIDRGAAELGSFAKALRENDLSRLFQQVQAIARQQPGLFIGGSLAAGFAVARLGKLVVADVSRDDLPTFAESDHAEA